MFIKRVAAFVGLSVFLTACAQSGSYVTVLSKESNTPTSMSMSYQKFSGYKARTITLDRDAPEIRVEIETQAGWLGLAVTGEDGKVYYLGSELPTSSFTVKTDRPGKVELKVEAKDHKGSYRISWE